MRMHEIAEEASERAVIKTLKAMGINADDQIQAQQDFAILRAVGKLALDPEFRKDLEHTRKMRLAMASIGVKALMTSVAIVVTALGAVFWMGIRDAILPPH